MSMISSDVKTNTYNEDGRILQVEYAIKNTTKAPTTVALKCSDGILLLGLSPEKEKVYKLQPNIYTSVSGIFPDALQLISFARVEAENYRELYESEIPLSSLVQIISELKQNFTIMGGKRPFGVCMLYAGMEGDEYCLMSTNPSGTVTKYVGVCVGEEENAVNGALRNELGGKVFSLEEGTREVLRILGKVKECGEKEIPMLEIFHFTKDKKRFLGEDEIRNLICKKN